MKFYKRLVVKLFFKLDKSYANIHNGWVPFGWHIAYFDNGYDIKLEFSPQQDESGFPLYERIHGWYDDEQIPVAKKLN